MAEHTQEPWYVVQDRAGWWFGNTTLNRPDFMVPREGLRMSEATARRIVACVNACAGIPTADLEHVVTSQFGNLLALAEMAKLIWRSQENDRKRHKRGQG